MKVFLFTLLRNWSREAFQRDTLEKTSACHSNVVNSCQISEDTSFWRNAWGRLIITHGDTHLLEIRGLQADVTVLLLEGQGDRGFSLGDRGSALHMG